jgi:2-hydroxychromene-2-carboxylate isomerase
VNRHATLYFDFISPFAYLLFKQLDKLPSGLEINFKPVLFAGLLKHWAHKGPAEIHEKRKFTYRFVQWQAEQLGIPLQFPPAHPFNPVKMLRLAVALGSGHDVIQKIFDFIWGKGGDVTDTAALEQLARDLGAASIDTLVENKIIKEQLIRNGEEAIANGVFGVPTFLADGNLFWGADSLGMLLAYLGDPNLLRSDEMRRISDLPVGVERKP